MVGVYVATFLAAYMLVVGLVGGLILYFLYNFVADAMGWPILGFWACVASAALISFIGGLFHSSNSKEK